MKILAERGSFLFHHHRRRGHDYQLTSGHSQSRQMRSLRDARRCKNALKSSTSRRPVRSFSYPNVGEQSSGPLIMTPRKILHHSLQRGSHHYLGLDAARRSIECIVCLVKNILQSSAHGCGDRVRRHGFR